MAEIVAIHAPAGRDGRVIEQILASVDIRCEILAPQDLVRRIANLDVGVVLLSQEALPTLRRTGLQEVLDLQPPWSDLPFLILTGRELGSDSAIGLYNLGHVTQLERPVHSATLVRAVRAALRARARQRDAERYLDDRAQAEQALRALTETLEAQVSDRTAELTAINERLSAEIRSGAETREKMEAMQAELIHVSRVSAMGTMASTLAHELNQPLTAVVNYVRGCHRLLTAQVAGAPAEVIGAMDAAAASAERAGQIVRQLRELVRTGDVEREPADLAAIVDDAMSIALIDAQLLAIECTRSLDPRATPVLVDAIQVQQVLINLVRNAVEAIGDTGNGKIVVASRARGDMAEITVSDNGPGIPPENLATLFSPFRSSKSQGMGLGLSICRTIVEANGGVITGSNAAGGGAVFRFELPLAANR